MHWRRNAPEAPSLIPKPPDPGIRTGYNRVFPGPGPMPDVLYRTSAQPLAMRRLPTGDPTALAA
uniref:Uncharacterized protein n=1 Tax=Ralstonia solanacearum TaxID=305 RepID=A0A809DUZ4_RALSL|nr:hypothetical protein RSP597_02420 [Ralstonia solanacearum]